MRVNISYSVELCEVPREVDKLLEECEVLFRQMCGKFGGVCSTSPLETIENLNDIREQLKTTDIRLSECTQILAGYVDIKAKMPLLSPQEQEHQPEEKQGDDEEL